MVKKDMLLLLSRRELSEVLGVHITTLNRWEWENKLLPLSVETKHGHKMYYTDEHIEIIKSWGDKNSLILSLKGF